MGILTDTGSETLYIIETLHSLDVLMNGSYPIVLKIRVAGKYGYLENKQSAKFNQSKLKNLIAMHISEKNNHNALAKKALCDALSCEKK